MSSEKKVLNTTLSVETVERISKNFIRIVFSADKKIDLNSDWIAPVLKLLFPLNGALVFPEADAENRIVWQEGLREKVRTYSLRHYDAKTGLITVDFVVHPAGIATIWAQQAKKGDQIGAIRIGAKRSFEAPKNWLFLGDISALPAISYTLAHLPKGHQAQAIVEIRDESDKFSFINSDKVHYILNPDEQIDAILNQLKTMTLAEDLSIWGGMETDKCRLIRNWLKEQHFELNLNREVKIISYWRKGFAEGQFKHSD